MEAFSLLKYWRGSGGGGGGFSTGGRGGGDGVVNLRNTASATIVTAVTHHGAEETDDCDGDDDGPFFDLEFSVQDEAEEEEEYYTKIDEENNDDENESQNDAVGSQDDSGIIDEEEEEEGEEEREFNFTISSNSSGNDLTDQNLTLSPSDDLFFKGKLVPIEPSSLVFNSAEPNSKSQFPASLLKSATKFRVSMLGFKKSKQNVTEKTDPNNGSVTATAVVADNNTSPTQQETVKEKEKEKEKQSKFFTVKFKVEEVPIMSLFTRDNNSSRKSQKHNVEDSEEKKFSKDVMQKYLKKVKPLYIRVSKRYGEKLKFSGQLNLSAVSKSVKSTPLTAGQKPNAAESTADESLLPEGEVGGETFVQAKNQKQMNNIPERLKVVCKHLGKSRSASSAVAAAPPAGVVASRRDDSLLQQQDGIQSAILHCKRSFNAPRDSDSSLLARSVSDPSHQKFDLSRKSSDQGKDGSFEPS